MRLCLVRSFLVSAVLALGVGCGGGSSNYQLPVDSPLKPFEAPTEEELVAAGEEDDWDFDLSEADEEGEDAAPEDEGEPQSDAGEAAPAETTADGDAAKVEAKPAKAGAGKADAAKATKTEKKPETKKAR